MFKLIAFLLTSCTPSPPTFLETSWRASSSKAFTLFSLDVMIRCSCLNVYGWKDILVSPWKWINTLLLYLLYLMIEGYLKLIKWSYQSTSNTVNHDSLRQVHSVCNSEDHQTSVAPCWPVKQVVHHILLTGPQKVKLKKKEIRMHVNIHRWRMYLSCQNRRPFLWQNNLENTNITDTNLKTANKQTLVLLYYTRFFYTTKYYKS